MDYDLTGYAGYSDSFGETAALGAIFAVLGTIWFIVLIIAVFNIIITWRVFVKAGKPGWASIVPIYNMYVLYEITGMKGWYAFLTLIPYVGSIIACVFLIMADIKLAKCFGKDSGFAVGLILLNTIFLAILAFDKKSVYTAPPVEAK